MLQSSVGPNIEIYLLIFWQVAQQGPGTKHCLFFSFIYICLLSLFFCCVCLFVCLLHFLLTLKLPRQEGHFVGRTWAGRRWDCETWKNLKVWKIAFLMKSVKVGKVFAQRVWKSECVSKSVLEEFEQRNYESNVKECFFNLHMYIVKKIMRKKICIWQLWIYFKWKNMCKRHLWS